MYRDNQKLAIYESYVKDLSIQTRLLLQSLEELEKEANQRVTLLENKLKKVNASLQHHHSLSDLNKTTDNIDTEKWKLIHENLDLKQDLDSLISFINIAKRTGKWDTKRLQLKTLPFDCIFGITNDDIHISTSLHKEIQYRDERIQVLQAEIEHLKKIQNDLSKQTLNLNSLTNENEFKGQNILLTKKIDELRSKYAEECQKNEAYKMEIRLKSNQLKDLEQEFNFKKQHYEGHIHDLSNKLKTISDRHRESTTILNTDFQVKKQQVEQLTQQVEQVINEKIVFENERHDLERQCRVKDTITADLEAQIRNLERQLTANNQLIIPTEPTVLKVEYEKLDQELNSTRKRLDTIIAEIKAKDILNNKLEQDIRLLKKFHDEQLEQQVQTAASDVEQLRTEIRTLKHLSEEKADEKCLELRTCQEHLSIEHNKNNTNEHEQQQLRNLLQLSNEQLEQIHNNLQEKIIKNEQFEQTINELNSRNNLLETKLFETMTLIDLRNKTIIDYEQQIDKIKNDLLIKTNEILDKQSHIDQLEQNLINKTAEVAQLTETLETDLIKNQHREKFAEDHATKSLNDINVLQRELRHLSESLVERERTNTTLNEQIQKLTNELRIKYDEFQQIQKSLNKQLAIKQDQLVRYDQNLHEVEIKCKYAKEECLIQEKEIIRLNNVQDEQANKIKILQQDLIKLQEQRDSIYIQYERSEGDLRNITILREDENRKYSEEFEKLNSEIFTLKGNEVTLLKNIDELKQNLLMISNERNEFREQNDNYQNELENLQKLLYDETESASKSTSKVTVLIRQLDEEQKRSNDSINQLNDIQMQLKSISITNDTLKSELNQARLLIQDHTIKENDMKQNLNRINSLLDEKTKCLDDCQHEIETLNHLISHLQIDYEKSKNDLSISHDQIVQLEIDNQTIKQNLIEKLNELTLITNRFHQIQQDYHTYEKNHRYSNDEYYEREQRIKSIENELTTIFSNYEKLQKQHQLLNEELNKYQYDLQDIEKSDRLHKERLMQSMDEAKIYKQKLTLLGDCFKIIVRKASETSEQWANISAHVDEQIIDLNGDVDRLTPIDERFEQSTKVLTHLQGQHEDFLVEFLSLKKIVGKTRLYLREYKRKWLQTNDENRQLHIEIKRLRDKRDDFHRAESLMHTKIDEQDIGLNQLRKELNNKIHAHSEAELTIEKLKHTLDEITFKYDQLMKNMTNANKKIENFENDIIGYTNENHLFQQTIQKLEKQLTTLHAQNQSLESTLELNEQSYHEKSNEYESLLISLKEANNNSLHLLEQREAELNTAQSELQTLKYEQSVIISKAWSGVGVGMDM
ncbi:unnamed protein product [Rotaria sp. Silwood1]|nr:unnamed protein product [Rotaria sp. Silwood1]